MASRSLRSFGALFARYRAHLIAYGAITTVVLSLPLSLSSAGTAAASAHEPAVVALSVAASFPQSAAERAQAVSRSLPAEGRSNGTIVPAVPASTSVAPDVPPILQYKLGPSDKLETLANYFKVSAEAIAYSNGISDPSLENQEGRTIMIPPGEGALYTVQDQDTPQSVAERFKVDLRTIMDWNRLYFEPEHFAPGQLIFVPGATVPGLVWVAVDKSAQAPQVNKGNVAAPSPNGRLAWPVGGYITQYFWALHSGLDLAAPYGTGIGASDAGTVIYAGWVAVGGLSVRIKHSDGFETGYYHMGAVFVAVGQQVERAQIIGTVGMTGVTTGPHVHWEMKLNGQFVNPLNY